jgi:pimeloyl-ACP methyl ester carboxylesterase
MAAPLVCLHGFLDTPRTWELVLPALEREHDVLAPALPLDDAANATATVDALERVLDDAGLPTVHLVGNSLGGYLALRLAARGRARTVVALAPAGGWAPDDTSWHETLRLQAELHEQAKALAPQADALLATPEGRRRATSLITTNFEHIPAELLAHQLLAIAACAGAQRLIDAALRDGWNLDAERITCPVRIVWGTADRLLPWPSAAARYRRRLPNADWVELDGIGHCPQLDVPVETAQLILGFTS